MSNVTVIQTHDTIYMGSDSAISATVNKQIYRVNEDGEKLFVVNDLLIFCSGKLKISYEIIEKFKMSPNKKIEELRNIAFRAYSNTVTDRDDVDLDIVVGTYENDRSVVYQISPYNNFEIIKREVEGSKYAIWTGGIKTDEAFEVVCSGLSSNSSIGYIFKNTFDTISFEGIGGILDVYKVNKDGINLVLKEKIKEKEIKRLKVDDLFPLHAIYAERLKGVIGEFAQIRANQIIVGENGETIPDQIISSSSAWNDAADQAGNSVQIGQSYSNTTITSSGIVSTRTDVKARSIMNANGFAVQKNTGTSSSPVWSNRFYTDSNGDLIVTGNINATSGTFSGDITASGTITGGTFEGGILSNGDIVGSTLTIGSGSSTVKIDPSYGIWAGSSSYSTAPAKIALNGSATFSNITLNGGSINWSNINSDPIATNALNTAEDAEDSAIIAQSIANDIADGTYNGGTFIDGKIIYSPTIMTGTSGRYLRLQGSELQSVDNNIKSGFTLDGSSGDLIWYTNGSNSGGIYKDDTQGFEQLMISHDNSVIVTSVDAVSLSSPNVHIGEYGSNIQIYGDVEFNGTVSGVTAVFA